MPYRRACRRQRAEQVANALLLLDVNVEVADHGHAALRADALLATRELTGLHVALQDVHAVLLIEGDSGDLIETHHVVLAHEAALAVSVVDEHLRYGCPAAGDQVGVGEIC